MRFHQWVEQQGLLSSVAIMQAAANDLAYQADETGIDWWSLCQKLPPAGCGLTSPALPVQQPKDRGRAWFIWFEQISRQGLPYPVIVFRTFRHSERKFIFNGLAWLYQHYRTAQPLTIPKHLHRLAPHPPEVSDADWRQARFDAFQKQFGMLPSAQPDSPYLFTKLGQYAHKVLPRIHMRQGQDKRGNYLAMPIENHQQQRIGFQLIYDRELLGGGNKRFLFPRLGLKKGSFIRIEGQTSKPIGVVEGVATGLSIALVRNQTIYVALDAYNLKPVVEGLGRQPVEIFADNDCSKIGKSNVGLTQAQAAICQHPDARLYKPAFAPQYLHRCPSDFNDLLQLQGYNALEKQLTTPTSTTTGDPI